MLTYLQVRQISSGDELSIEKRAPTRALMVFLVIMVTALTALRKRELQW